MEIRSECQGLKKAYSGDRGKSFREGWGWGEYGEVEKEKDFFVD